MRTAVLEVVRYDHASSESIVVSGWGEREDWYRNIPAHSPLLVDTGSQRYASFHRFLTDESPAAGSGAAATGHRAERNTRVRSAGCRVTRPNQRMLAEGKICQPRDGRATGTAGTHTGPGVGFVGAGSAAL